MDQPPIDETRAVAVDPRNDGWVRGVQPLITRADDGWGILFVSLILGALLAPLLYVAVLTRERATILGAAGVMVLFAGAVVLFLLDMRDRRKVSGGRRVAARVVSAGTQATGSTRTSLSYVAESEFVSPQTGEILRARLCGHPRALRKVKRGDAVWVAYLDDGCYEAL